MRYTNLPPVGHLTLPKLEQSDWAHSQRTAGVQLETLFMHRWGSTDWQTESIDGIDAEFKNPASQASAHLAYAGEVGHSAGRCIQGVLLAAKAWTEAADNSEGVSIECGDAMWLGHDPDGFARAARIAGWLCQHLKLPTVWVHDPHSSHAHGISRHGDGGAPDGGHFSCPTDDTELFAQFVERVKLEVAHGGYRTVWAR